MELSSREPRLHPVPDRTFGELLRSQRRADGATQAELGRRFGVRQQTIGAWEKGERPQGRFLAKLADYLGLPDEAALLRLVAPVQPAPTASVPTRDPVDLLTESLAARIAEGDDPAPEVLATVREALAYYRERNLRTTTGPSVTDR
jgi:transcriptional regulator with XRE-family HTH domain